MSLSRLGVAKRRAPLTIIHISLPSPGLLVDSGAAGPFHVRLAGGSASLRLFGPIYPDRSQLRDGGGGGGSGLRLPSLPSVSAGPREPNNNNPVNAQPGPSACQTASREVSVTKAVQLPNRPPDSESPTADLSEGLPEVGTSHSDFAVRRGPSPAAVPP